MNSAQRRVVHKEVEYQYFGGYLSTSLGEALSKGVNLV